MFFGDQKRKRGAQSIENEKKDSMMELFKRLDWRKVSVCPVDVSCYFASNCRLVGSNSDPFSWQDRASILNYLGRGIRS
jgi:hypothetical protein